MKTKYFIFGMITCFIIICIFGCVLSVVSFNDKIYVKTLDNFDINIGTFDARIDSLKVNETCKNSLKNLSDRVKSTYYNNDVTIKEYDNNYFKDGVTFYALYLEAFNECEIDNDAYSYITEYAIESQTYPQLIHSRRIANYELKFTDYINYKEIHEISDNIGTYSNKTLELKVLSELLGVIDPVVTFNKEDL